MRARYQLIIGLGASIVSMAASLLVVPLYVRILGMEAYGLIGFLVLLQGLLQILDLGFAPTISREVARDLASGAFARARALLASLATLYGVVGMAIMAAVAMASPLVATHWLHPRILSYSTVVGAVALMGVVLAVRWPVGIYTGALIGAYRSSTASLVTLCYALGANLGGVGVVLLLPRIEALFAWQAIAGLIQLLVLRRLAWQAMGGGERPRPSWTPLIAVWRFSAGMGLVTLAAVGLQQLDKLLVSRLVSLEAFGTFALASLLGRALYGFINPLYNIIHPRFIGMLTGDGAGELRRIYGYWTALFCCLFFPASTGLALAAEPLLVIWTGNVATAAQAAPLVSLIAIGAALHGVMYFPFALQVAAGDARTPLFINVALVVFYVPVLTFLLHAHGVRGAAEASVLLFGFYLVIGTIVTHRRWLRGLAATWLGLDVGLPALVCVIVATVAVHFSSENADMVEQLFIAAVAAAVAASGCLAIVSMRYGELRHEWCVLFGHSAKGSLTS